MKKVEFLDDRSNIVIAVVRTCSEFMAMALSVSLKDRPFIVGRPFKKAYVTVLFQNPWLGKVNPYWTKRFSCYGDEITLDEARGLFKPQLPIPLDQRPSRNQDKFGQSPVRNPRKKSRRNFDRRTAMPEPSNNYQTDGRAFYKGQYVSWGAYNGLHAIGLRTTTKTSVKTPGYKSIPKASLPWNNHSYSVIVGYEKPGKYGYGTPGSNEEADGYLRGGTKQGYRIIDYINTGWMNRTEKTSKDALSKALTRAKSQSVNLAQAYAERKQTVSLMTSSINRLATLALALKKGNVKHVRELINGYKSPSKQPSFTNTFNSTGTHIVGRRYVHVVRRHEPRFKKQTFADLWLEYSYGWKPLLSDIYGSAELLANTYHLAKPISVSATKQIETVLTSAPSQYEKVKTTITDRSRVVLQFQEPTEWTNFMSKTGIGNPALLAWELLPYSFVVDWMIPVGTYLGNLDALVGLNFKRWSTQTTMDVSVDSRSKNVYSTTIPGWGDVYVVNSDNDVYVQKRTKNRVVSTLLPSVPLPEFRPSMGVERSLSAISLLTQIFNRGKTSAK
jgi:hypothetical protein